MIYKTKLKDRKASLACYYKRKERSDKGKPRENGHSAKSEIDSVCKLRKVSGRPCTNCQFYRRCGK